MRPTLSTRWDTAISATNAHPEYPRPSLVRSDWLNLNGLWDFSITRLAETNSIPFTNRILVPFPVESVLSGAMHPLLTERQRMWYRREFTLPETWRGQRILLHFDAVDWETKAWLNGRELGSHRGGYDRFTFDITDALKPGGPQQLILSVLDPTDSGAQPRGKQMLHPRQPFFSACSGIWQTVWLEPVPAVSIESLHLVPDIDAGVLRIAVQCRGETNGVTAQAVAFDEDKEVGHATAGINQEFQLAVPNARLWSPDTPFLYDLKVTLLRDGKKIDAVSSYFGMRLISLAKVPAPRGTNEFPVILLNHRRVFQWGPLDQGYWPDGIYTAPTDEALRYDVEVMKQLGFNLCRKHVKVEPERWYYWCDKLGLLVWQDMPNADVPPQQQQKEIQRAAEPAGQFEQELRTMIAQNGNHPSIVVWVLFNQGWGQYDTARLTTFCKHLDPSRLVISASGWNDMKTGDISSYHHYPLPLSIRHDGTRACVAGECGGLALVVPGHLWGGVGRWNTTYFDKSEGLFDAYKNLVSNLTAMRDQTGLSAAVVTQLTDVEAELDGFITYDRAILKLPADTVRTLNQSLTGGGVEPAGNR